MHIADGHSSDFQLIEQECWVSSCCLFAPSSVGVKPGRRHSSVCVCVCVCVCVQRSGANISSLSVRQRHSGSLQGTSTLRPPRPCHLFNSASPLWIQSVSSALDDNNSQLFVFSFLKSFFLCVCRSLPAPLSPSSHILLYRLYKLFVRRVCLCH
ncbi:hypothetical protein ATANTOWER_031767 [Ataeniobius toweri]|uniref:Uncharacterized protein n=1 Tax=Ataeniobius toweri TaxID=208326 RepID=A0ABU7CED9_9TELE|nr:hypothetical protein [Ataeniobius toweri]